jgi:hypothetical protein
VPDERGWLRLRPDLHAQQGSAGRESEGCLARQSPAGPHQKPISNFRTGAKKRSLRCNSLVRQYDEERPFAKTGSGHMQGTLIKKVVRP